MTDGKESTNNADAELSVVVDKIQQQQRTLLVACMTLLLFVVSPDSNALLAAAKEQLEADMDGRRWSRRSSNKWPRIPAFNR